MIKEIYEINGGYGYKIFDMDQLKIHQEFNPDQAGFEPMTIEIANSLADKAIEKLSTVAREQPEEEKMPTFEERLIAVENEIKSLKKG